VSGGVATVERERTARAPEAPAEHERAGVGWLWALAGLALVMAVTVWIISPRFRAHFPWVVDDWYAIHNAPLALHHLLRLDYVPAEVRDPLRYRPSYNAVWNSLLFHTFDGPTGMKAANLWNLLRIAMLLSGLMLLVWLGVPARRRDGWTLAAAVVAALVLVATKQMVFEIAQFGPVEPLLMGAMVLGGALLVGGGALWLRGRRWYLVAPTLAVGWILWVFGVFEKEASICALALAPFLALELNARVRDAGRLPRPLWRDHRAQAIAVAALVPVLFMLWQVKKIAGGGKTVYGNDIHGGTTGLLTNAREAFTGMWNAVEAQVGSPLFTGLAVAAGAAVLASAATRRRVPWFALGLFVTAWVVFVFEGLGGEFFPRYYLPTMVLLLAATAVALLDAPAALRGAAAVAGLLYVVTNLGAAHHRVLELATAQIQGAQTVSRIAALHPGSCPVYMGRMANEPAEAIPVLVGLLPSAKQPGCRPSGYEAFMVDGAYDVALVTDDRIMRACAGRGGWKLIDRTPLYAIRACRRLATGDVGGRPVRGARDRDRLVPGVGFSERLPARK
jgi:hypothetical protein